MKNNREQKRRFNNGCPGVYCTVMFVLSFIDLSFGIASIFSKDILTQMLSLSASIATLCILIFGYIINVNGKGSGFTTIMSLIDVIIGFISIIFVFNSLRIIFGLTSGTVGLKVVKTAIQTEKAKKFFGVIKPKLYDLLVKILPAIIVNFIDKIIKKEKQKGDMIMGKVKNFFCNFGTGLKNNAFTISGSILLTATGALNGTWVVKHILATGLLPIWASYLVGIAICAFIYGFVEFAILKYGAENKTQVKLRKIIKNLFGLIGATDFIEKIEEIEAEAIEVEKARKAEEERKAAEAAEAERVRIEAEEKIKQEKIEAARIEEEAMARIQEEEERKIAEAEAERAKIEAQKKIEEENRLKAEHERRVQEMIAKIKAGK